MLHSFPTLSAVLNAGSITGSHDINFSNGRALKTTQVANDTFLLQAWDVDNALWVTFGTMTAGNVPTFNLDASVTIGGKILDSGIAIPTSFDVTNVAASSVQDQQWLRIGNVVNLSGRFTLRPISVAVATELGISLPVPSTTNFYTYVSGTANFSDSVSLSAGVEADIVNNRMAIRYVNTAETGTKTGHYSVTYLINS